MEFTKPYSEATAEVIDQELKKMVDEMYERTKALLIENRDALEAVAELLLEKETINVDDVIRLVGPRPFDMPSSYADFLKRAWQDGAEELAKRDAEEDAAAAAAVAASAAP